MEQEEGTWPSVLSILQHMVMLEPGGHPEESCCAANHHWDSTAFERGCLDGPACVRTMLMKSFFTGLCDDCRPPAFTAAPGQFFRKGSVVATRPF